MKQLLLDLFSESSSISMMRLLSFICVLTASALAGYGLHSGTSPDALSILCGVFLGAGITGKVTQKIVEKRDGPKAE